LPIVSYSPFQFGKSSFALARLNTDGSLDTGFGTNGLVVTAFDPDTNSAAHSVLIQPGGKIVLTGYSESQPNHPDEFALARYFASTAPVGSALRPTVSNTVYELPIGSMAGQSFPSSQIAVANQSGASVLDSATAGTSGGTLHARLVRRPVHDPSFQLNDNGTFTYSPDTSFSGSDYFTFKVNDGTADSNTATVNIVTQGSSTDSDGDGVSDTIEAFGPNGGTYFRGGRRRALP
jgi:hypothetical protein